jgi:hypothetical protein
MLNFDEHLLSNSQLAELVTIGLPKDLRAMVNNFELLLKKPFDYKYFKQCLGGFFKTLPCKQSNQS